MTPDDSAKNENTLPDEREQLIAEIFHDLTQPLTTLHCCLELALRKERRSSKLREDLLIALQQAEKIAELTIQLRELASTDTKQCSLNSLPEPAPPLAWPSRCCG